MDAANTSTVSDGESHVALLAPGGAPGVSHDPVLLATGGAPADNVGGVVELSAATGVVEDTATVALEDGLVSLNGDSEDTLLEGSLHLARVLGSNTNVSRSAGGVGIGWLVRVVLAGTITTSVSVVGLVVGVVALVVLEGVGLDTTVATVAGSVTINELLLRQAVEVAGLGGPVVLHASHGGEGPAGTA